MHDVVGLMYINSLFVQISVTQWRLCLHRPRFRSLRSLFGQGFYKSSDCNRVTGVYELLLKKRSDTGSPGM